MNRIQSEEGDDHGTWRTGVTARESTEETERKKMHSMGFMQALWLAVAIIATAAGVREAMAVDPYVNALSVEIWMHRSAETTDSEWDTATFVYSDGDDPLGMYLFTRGDPAVRVETNNMVTWYYTDAEVAPYAFSNYLHVYNYLIEQSTTHLLRDWGINFGYRGLTVSQQPIPPEHVTVSSGQEHLTVEWDFPVTYDSGAVIFYASPTRSTNHWRRVNGLKWWINPFGPGHHTYVLGDGSDLYGGFHRDIPRHWPRVYIWVAVRVPQDRDYVSEPAWGRFADSFDDVKFKWDRYTDLWGKGHPPQTIQAGQTLSITNLHIPIAANVPGNLYLRPEEGTILPLGTNIVEIDFYTDFYAKYVDDVYTSFVVIVQQALDPSLDEDGDGFLNGLESQYGSDPRSPDSTPALVIEQERPTTLAFPSASGRLYRIQSCVNLGLPWNTIESVNGTGGRVTRRYGIDDESKFYRIVSP